MKQRKVLKTIESIADGTFSSFSDLLNEVVEKLVNNVDIDVTGGRVWQLDVDKKSYKLLFQAGDVPLIDDNFLLKISENKIFDKIADERTILADETNEDLIKLGIFRYSASGVGSKYKLDDKYYYQYLIAVNSDSIDDELRYTLNIVATVLTSKLKERKLSVRQKSLDEEIDKAKQLIRSILPEHEYSFHGYDLFGITMPADYLAGDFYDYLTIGYDEDRLGIVVGDAASKGISAAAEAMYISGAVRMASAFQIKISPLMYRLNRLVNKIFADDRFCSLFYGEISDDKKGLFLYANAGHNPPIFVCSDTKKVSYLDATGPLLGPAPNSKYQTDSINFNPGDVLVIYSDGITEAANNNYDFFEESRLEKIIIENINKTPKEIVYEILTRVENFSTNDSQYQDDKTLVIIKEGISNKMSLAEKIKNAGVVGAGGAGFPTHIKATSKVEYVLANGAECEPLIHKDFEIMVNFPKEIVNGMDLMVKNTGAKKGYFGVKTKNAEAIEAIENHLSDTEIEMSLLGDFYPSGDEYELVYHATKRLIPPHGLPLDVGCVVNNVETFYNINNAINDIPVTEKFVCVTGLVKNPSTFWAPIGATIKDLIEFAGGTTTENYGVFVSGLLMGKLTFDINEPITKATAGIIILPKDHYMINRQNREEVSMNRIGKSACDQCSYCTEFCPRYLLGYDVQPHKVMRSLVFSKTGEAVWNQYADLCCSCGLCSLYSCPEDLYPREACDQGKAELRKQGVRYEQPKPVKVHPIKEGRRVPLKQLMKKLNVTQYNFNTPFNEGKPNPKVVKIFLKQHVGAPSNSIVTKGQLVKKGDLLGEIPEGQLGARIHSSIDGQITELTNEYVIISAN